MANLSTKQVADEVSLSRATLERWLSSGKLRAPKTLQIGKNKFRDWTPEDIERIRELKQKIYRKGRGRKPRKIRARK